MMLVLTALNIFSGLLAPVRRSLGRRAGPKPVARVAAKAAAHLRMLE
jgi:hypothetical protein